MVDIISESKGKDGRKIVLVSVDNLIPFMKEMRTNGFDKRINTEVIEVESPWKQQNHVNIK